MRPLLCSLFLVLSFSSCLSQESIKTIPADRVFTKQFELRHDNDFLLFTDRYYTTGTFIGLNNLLEKRHDSADTRNYRAYILQQFYTPADLLETKLSLLERPYVGFFGFSNAMTFTSEKRHLELELLLGFTGPFSGAERVQSLFHDAGEDARIATWEGQIKNSMHANGYGSYTFEWKLQPNPFSVHLGVNPKAAFGTKDIYLQNDFVAFFGKRNPIKTTSAYQQIGSTSEELFFAVRMGYRYVFHNALFEGNIIKDTSIFLKDPYRNLFLYNFEINYRRGRNSYKLGYNFTTPQTRGVKPILYNVFSFSRIF